MDRPVNVLCIAGAVFVERAMQTLAAPLGLNLRRAETGDAAVELLEIDDFALIVLHAAARGSGAAEAARQVQASARGRAVPMLAIAADAAALDADAAYALGAVDHLVEPLAAAQLRRKVAAFAALYRAGPLGAGTERSAALARERGFLAAVLEAVEDGIVACDANGVLTHFNRATRDYHRLLDEPLTPDQWTSRYRLFRADGTTPLPKEEIPLYRALRGETVRNVEMVIAAKDGTRRTLRATGRALFDEAGTKLGAVVSMHDVTPRIAAAAALDAVAREQIQRAALEASAALLHESNERFALLLESSGEGIYGMAPDGTCTFLNRAGAAMLGYEPAELIGWPIRDVIGDQRPDAAGRPHAVDRIERAAAAGQAMRVDDATFWRKDGSPVPVAYSLSPMVVGGKNAGAVITFTDVTERRAVLARLSEGEERLRLATEAAELGLWVWDIPRNRLTWENDRPLAMFGLAAPGTPIEANQFINEFIHADDLGHFRRAVTRAFASGGRLHFEGRHHRLSDGDVRWIELTGLVHRDLAGAPKRVIGTALDITGRKRDEEERRVGEERFHALFESMDEGFCIIQMEYDASGRPVDYRYLEVNRAFASHAGMTDVVGHTMRELMPSDDRFWVDTYGRVAMTGEAIRFDLDAPAVGRWFDVSASRVGGPGSHKVAVLFNDITPKKRVEADLRRLAADLSEVDRRKTEFLATLAHELRNPLAPIRNGLQLMRLAPGDLAAVGRARDMMERQLAHLVHLVDDLLDIARISGDKVELKRERVALARVVADAVETSLPLIEAGRHHLSVELPGDPVLLDVDPNRISQVLSNLLNNASKYSPKGGRIVVSAQCEGTDVAIGVVDNGVGIPSESLKIVFDMFAQVGRNMDHAQGGLGIGLTLVRRLVTLHGGSVTAESEGVGKGSRFVVRLPIASADLPLPPDPAPRDDGALAAPTDRLRVLVVDDNIDAAESLAMVLRIGGHEVEVANDGDTAIRAAQTFGPDVVFLDIGIPGKNGYEVARLLRQSPGAERLFLVALTGWGTDEDRARSKEAGFDHHLTKPAELRSVDRLLAEVAAGRRRLGASTRFERRRH